MMNSVYDFSEIQLISDRQKRMIFGYVLVTFCFAILLTFICFTLKNSLLITLTFAILLSIFILASILFWKIKYGILNEYKVFLDNMETGNRSDYVGRFMGREEAAGEESFDRYIFIYSNKQTSFLIHKQHAVDFSKNVNYHIVHVGSYVYGWKDAREIG